jgi:histidyl-tRNA synthetase
MELITRAPKGTNDILPEETREWKILEDVMSSEAELNGFAEIRTPVFEHTELFQRGVGDATDVVEKQMYTFEDKGGRSVTLRPEGTAGAVRAMLESGLYNGGYPIKLYYHTACYRYEKPQAGRMREFRQFGVEMFGAADPAADAQVIALGKSIFDRLSLKNIKVLINSIGCPECRREYHKALKEFFTAKKDELCETCHTRLDRNPMRILDCKSPVCAGLAEDAPVITEYICEDCKTHHEKVKTYLTDVGIAFEEDSRLVRGLDYYSRTVFEYISEDIGGGIAIGGGGRYDGLVEEFGGKPTSGLGFGLGMDRILLVMHEQKVEFPMHDTVKLFIASIGEEAGRKAFLLANQLHKCGISADCELCGRGLKAQLKYADRIKAQFTIVLGEDELQTEKAQMKNMKTGEKVKISLGESFIDDYLTEATKAGGLSF